MKLSKFSVVVGAAVMAAASHAQVPDLLNALDAGSHSLGAGGSLHATSADTFSAYYNPAGLGYLDRREIEIAYRNVPNSNSTVSNSYDDQVRSTQTHDGPNDLTHVGVAMPLSNLRRGAPGTVALTYTMGGYIDDSGAIPNGSALPVASGLGIANYRDHIEARSNFFTLAYGRTNASQTLSYGLGLIYLEQQIQFQQSGTFIDNNGNPVSGYSLPDVSSTLHGFGAIAGLQYSPARNPNLSLGLSYRTQINLSGDDDAESYYGRVPARLIGGAAYRFGSLRRDHNDFMVLGLDIQHFFATDESMYFDRGDQTVTGVGLEYFLDNGGSQIPLRIGYQAVPAGGGFDYASRNAFTYGIGYRTRDGKYGLDLNYVHPDNGGGDVAITASYRY